MDFDAVIALVEAAGRLAMQSYRVEFLDSDRKADGSVVTAADLAVQRLLVDGLRRLTPDYGLVAEEEELHEDAPMLWVLDPIDGTSSFAVGAPGWGISLGLLDAARQPIAGMFCAPAWGQTWLARPDGSPPTLDGRPLPPSVADPDRTFLCDSKLVRAFSLSTFDGKVRSLGSTAMHVYLAATPGYTAACLTHVHPWDLAGAQAIAERVGVEFRYLDGTPVDYSPLLPDHVAPQPIVVAPAGMFETVQSWITPR